MVSLGKKYLENTDLDKGLVSTTYKKNSQYSILRKQPNFSLMGKRFGQILHQKRYTGLSKHRKRRSPSLHHWEYVLGINLIRK